MSSLISQGADVNDYGFWLGPALNAALLGGHLSIVKLLLKHRADPNVIGHLAICTWCCERGALLGILMFLLTAL